MPPTCHTRSRQTAGRTRRRGSHYREALRDVIDWLDQLVRTEVLDLRPRSDLPLNHRVLASHERIDIRGMAARAADNAAVDDDVEERFTQLARTRLADTLSEAARMLTEPPAEDDAAPPGRPGRGFDDILLARSAPAGEEPAPAGAPPTLGGVEELEAEVERLRGELEALRDRTRAVEAWISEHDASLRELREALERVARQATEALDQVGRHAAGAPAATDAGRAAVSLIDPVLKLVPPPPGDVAGEAPEAVPTRAPEPSEPERRGSAERSAAAQQAVAGAPADDAYTWAFAEPAHRRFWRRRPRG